MKLLSFAVKTKQGTKVVAH